MITSLGKELDVLKAYSKPQNDWDPGEEKLTMIMFASTSCCSASLKPASKNSWYLLQVRRCRVKPDGDDLREHWGQH